MAFLHGTDRVPDIFALVGVFLFFAGLHLLWHSREDLFFWVQEYVRLFRLNVRQATDQGPAELPAKSADLGRRGTARIVLGMALAFFVAPTLITLSLAF